MVTLDEDAVIAVVDLVGRAGAREFEIGYLNDDDDRAFSVDGPQWYAHAQYRGARIIEEGHPGPTEAAEALARKLLTGAKCRCGKLVALSDHGAVFTSGQMVDGTSWTPEQAAVTGQCRWTRLGKRWEPSCDAPSIKVAPPCDCKFACARPGSCPRVKGRRFG